MHLFILWSLLSKHISASNTLKVKSLFCFGHCKELMILTYFHELKNTGHLFRFQNNITPVNIMSILISCLRMLLHLSYCLLIWKDVTCNEVTSR